MRRDSIFYKLFQQFPSLVFALLPNPPANAAAYRFESVAVKEPKFEIDGVFLPPEEHRPGIIYFFEIQFQKDEQLYERLFAEAFLYFYRHRSRFQDWRAIVIYPTRRVEQANTLPYQDLLSSQRVHVIYLEDLDDIAAVPLEVALLLLTTTPEAQAPATARDLLQRSQQVSPPAVARMMIEMVTTIMVYKFTHLSRQEVEAMLDIKLQETRVYQEAKAEGREEGLEAGREAGREEGREAEARSLIRRQLTRRFAKLPKSITAQLEELSLPQLEVLAEALLDFTAVADLAQWLQAQSDAQP